MSYPVYIVIAVVAVILIIFISSYNTFVRLRNRCEEAFATIDTELKRRFDLVPNLVEVVKGYARHEKETLEGVIAARNKGLSAGTIEEKDGASKEMSHALARLIALKENYPELKANENFLKLQDELTKTENSIMQSRKYYNAVVKELNTRIEIFPHNIIASVFGFKKGVYLQADEEERKRVEVKF